MAREPGTEERWKKRGDSFWNIFMPTKNGKIKSTLVVNSFSLSILFMAIYIAAYALLLGGLDAALQGRGPVWLLNLAEGLVPAVIASALCNVFHFIFKEKKLVPAAYAWVAVYTLGASIYLILNTPAEVRSFTTGLILTMVPAVLLTGCGLAAFLYLRHLRLHPRQEPLEEAPPWKRRR